MSSNSTSSPPPGQRPTISDGKSTRPIWRPSDGNGDPDISIFEATRYTATGHPTWKLYCGNAPASINGIFQEPPKHVYLDDRACYRILHFAGYNGAERGRMWRHDFDNKGGVKPHRRGRGRPAIVEGGGIAEVRMGAAKTYRFGGAEDLKEVDLIAQEVAAQARGDTLIVTPGPPGKRTNTVVATKTKRKLTEDLLAGVDTSRKENAYSDDDEIKALANGRAKKQRPLHPLEAETFEAIGTNSMSELKATIVSMQDRARITSDALLDLQKRNRELETNLKAQQVLYDRATVDLTAARTRNANLHAQCTAMIHTSTPSMAKDLEIATLRNQAAIYRTIAIQLWGKHGSTSALQEHGATAARAIETLRSTLVEMKEELQPMMRQKGREAASWGVVERTMTEMLGDEWERFDREASDRARDE